MVDRTFHEQLFSKAYFNDNKQIKTLVAGKIRPLLNAFYKSNEGDPFQKNFLRMSDW